MIKETENSATGGSPVKNITTDELKRMTETEGLILQGCGGDAQEWADGINKMFTEEGLLLEGDTFKDISVFEHDGLINMLFSMEDVKLDVGKLAMWRLQTHDNFGGTWLSDYLPNRLGVSRDAPERDEAEPEVIQAEEVEPFEPSSEDSMEYPIDVYVGNVHDTKVESVVVPLPITQEALQPILDELGIKDRQDIEIFMAATDISRLEDVLSETMQKTMSPTTFDELNYLAVRLKGMEEDEYALNIFRATIHAKKNCGSIAEIINLTFTENINCFDVQPTFSAEQYGDFLVSMGYDKHAEAFTRLVESDNPEDRALAVHIEKLEKHIDYKAFGKAVVEEEQGVFTVYGYLTGGEGLQEIYKGVEDIPDENRIFTKPGETIKPILKLDDANIAETIIKLHAVSGCNMENAVQALKTLNEGTASEYILSVSEDRSLLAPVVDAYRRGDTTGNLFREMIKEDDTKIFAVNIYPSSEPAEGEFYGAFIELNNTALYENHTRHAAITGCIKAVRHDGSQESYDLVDWADFSREERGRFKEYAAHFPDEDLKEAAKQYSSIMGAHEMSSVAVEADVFLQEANAVYMEKAENPQPALLRISNDAARELLARGDADVYALIENGEKKLEAFEALRPLCFADYKETAIKKEALPGFDKWAERKVGDINRKAEKDKTKEKGADCSL
jgi:hypothetical protein